MDPIHPVMTAEPKLSNKPSRRSTDPVLFWYKLIGPAKGAPSLNYSDSLGISSSMPSIECCAWMLLFFVRCLVGLLAGNGTREGAFQAFLVRNDGYQLALNLFWLSERGPSKQRPCFSLMHYIRIHKAIQRSSEDQSIGAINYLEPKVPRHLVQSYTHLHCNWVIKQLKTDTNHPSSINSFSHPDSNSNQGMDEGFTLN